MARSLSNKLQEHITPSWASSEMSTSEAHRTLKRPRHDDNESMSAGRASGVHHNGAKVKREQSLTPPPPQRKLVMFGTKRFAPFPLDCLPPFSGYKRNRRIWAKKCQSEIEALKLQTEKLLIRYVKLHWIDLYSDPWQRRWCDSRLVSYTYGVE